MESKFSDLVLRADIAVSILANDTSGDVDFLPLRPNPTTGAELDELANQLVGRSLEWVGLIARVEGVPQVALDSLVSPRTISKLTAAFIRYCEAFEITGRTGDELQWLENLWSLEDPRL